MENTFFEARIGALLYQSNFIFMILFMEKGFKWAKIKLNAFSFK